MAVQLCFRSFWSDIQPISDRTWPPFDLSRCARTREVDGRGNHARILAQRQLIPHLPILSLHLPAHNPHQHTPRYVTSLSERARDRRRNDINATAHQHHGCNDLTPNLFVGWVILGNNLKYFERPPRIQVHRRRREVKI